MDPPDDVGMAAEDCQVPSSNQPEEEVPCSQTSAGSATSDGFGLFGLGRNLVQLLAPESRSPSIDGFARDGNPLTSEPASPVSLDPYAGLLELAPQSPCPSSDVFATDDMQASHRAGFGTPLSSVPASPVLLDAYADLFEFDGEPYEQAEDANESLAGSMIGQPTEAAMSELEMGDAGEVPDMWSDPNHTVAASGVVDMTSVPSHLKAVCAEAHHDHASKVATSWTDRAAYMRFYRQGSLEKKRPLKAELMERFEGD